MSACRVLALGDLAVDVVVEADVIALDDDQDAPISLHLGGQAANVARWVAELGGRSGLLTSRLGNDLAGRLAHAVLAQEKVTVLSAFGTARTPVVCSLVTAGKRTMLSDGGGVDFRPVAPWDSMVSGDPGWLHVSGYALARSADLEALTRFLNSAVDRDWRLAVDLSAVSVVERLGADRVVGLLARTAASVVFANDAEWAALGSASAAVSAARVLKHGADGCTFVSPRSEGGHRIDLPVEAGPVVDPTGAGDALAAGWFVGGPPLAMATAARCVAARGSLSAPRPPRTEETRNR